MYQDYVHDKIWIFRYYVIFFYLICGFDIFRDTNVEKRIGGTRV
jgi:hypothetical protein